MLKVRPGKIFYDRSKMTSQLRHPQEMVKIFSFQIGSYCIPLERKFQADQKSLWDLCPEMKWEKVMSPGSRKKWV